jgi:hypothetical protein
MPRREARGQGAPSLLLFVPSDSLGSAREALATTRKRAPAQASRVAAPVGRRNAHVLVELEQGGLVHGETSVRGVRAQCRVHAERCVARGEDRPQPLAGPDPVRDEFAREQGDAHVVREDERRGDRRARH